LQVGIGRLTGDFKMVAMPRGLRKEEGQGLVEYALIILFVAVVLVVALTMFSGALGSLYQKASNALG